MSFKLSEKMLFDLTLNKNLLELAKTPIHKYCRIRLFIRNASTIYTKFLTYTIFFHQHYTTIFARVMSLPTNDLSSIRNIINRFSSSVNTIYIILPV